MMMTTNWENIGVKEGGNNNNKEIKYLKFEEGTTIIRLLDEAPVSYYSHWITTANKGKGVGIACTGKGCPVCKVIAEERKLKVPYNKMTYNKPIKHMINVLVKKINGTDVNEVMLLEAGNGIFGSIKDQITLLTTMGYEPDLTAIDLIINRTGKGFGDTKYSVICNPATVKPLTEEEKALEKYDLFKVKPDLDNGQVIDLIAGKSLDEVCGNAEETEDSQPELDLSGSLPF